VVENKLVQQLLLQASYVEYPQHPLNDLWDTKQAGISNPYYVDEPPCSDTLASFSSHITSKSTFFLQTSSEE
jgi:hypothetical protein